MLFWWEKGIEVIKRGELSGIKAEFNFSQTMIRVKDPKKSVDFYRDNFGMKLIHEKHFEAAKFSLYFMASLEQGEEAPEDTKSEESNQFVKNMFNPVLELTHNHGTEEQQGQVYHNGNEEPKGFGHLAFLVNDVSEASKVLEKRGVAFEKKVDSGKVKGIAFVKDPDNYCNYKPPVLSF